MAKARTPKEIEILKSFNVHYDDTDDRIHVMVTTSRYSSTPTGRARHEGTTYEKEALVLRRSEWVQLMKEGMEAFTYHVELVQKGGVRIDPNTDQVVLPATSSEGASE